MRIVVGLTKKVGLPGFGSLAATCQVESGEFSSDSSGGEFARRVERAFDCCRKSVEAELQRHRPGVKQSAEGGLNGHPSSNGDRPATPKQLNALRAMASKSRLSRQAIESVFGGKPIDALTISEASAAIDRFKRGPAENGVNGRTHQRFEGGA